MTRIIPLLLLFVVTLNPVHPQEQSEKLFARSVSLTRMRNHVKSLVALGNRQGGTPSGDRSVAYVLNSFRQSRVSAEVEVDKERLVFVNHQWKLQVVEPRRLRNAIRNEWLAGFSPSTPSTVAHLVSLDREPDEDLDSAIVLTGRDINERLYLALVKAGASAILSYAPADSTIYQNSALISTLKRSHSNRIPLFNLSYGNGKRLREAVESGDTVRVRFMTKTTIAEGQPKTVVATIPGKSDEYFLVCAHGDSDSGGPGADDNGSGVAGVLELARVFGRLIRTGQLPVPEKTLKFAVWGCEYYSTEEFVRREQDRLGLIQGVLNYDEIGTGATRDCIYFEPNDLPHHEPMMKVLREVSEDYVGKRGFWTEATTNPSQGGTDSYVFLPSYLDKLDVARVLIPSVTVYTAAWNRPRTIPQTPGWSSTAWKGHPDSVTIDFSRYYHSSLDTPERTTELEPHNMSWAVKAVGIALLRLAW